MIKKIHPLFIVLALATVLRLILIDASFWLDEAAQALESTRPLSQQLDIVKDFQPPLYHLVVHVFSYLSHSEAWLRTTSLIAGIGTIIYTFLLTKTFTNQKIAGITALLLTTSQFHIFYSQELRPYSLAAFFLTGSMYYFFRILAGDQVKIKYVTFSVLALYTMYVAPVFLLAQLLVAYIHKPKFTRTIFRCLILSALFFLPLMPLVATQLYTGLSLKAVLPGWSQVVSPPLIKSLPLTFSKLITGRISYDQNLFTLLLVILTIFPTLVLGIHALRHHAQAKTLILLIGLTTAIAWITSIWIPILEPKRMLALLPLMYLTITLSLDSFKFAHFMVASLILGNSLALILYWSEPINQREPWRQAVQIIESQTNKAIIYQSFFEPFAPWVWYQSSGLSVQTPTQIPLDTSPIFSYTDDYFVFEYLMDLTDPGRLAQTALSTSHDSPIPIYASPTLGLITKYSHSNEK